MYSLFNENHSGNVLEPMTEGSPVPELERLVSNTWEYLGDSSAGMPVPLYAPAGPNLSFNSTGPACIQPRALVRSRDRAGKLCALDPGSSHRIYNLWTPSTRLSFVLQSATASTIGISMISLPSDVYKLNTGELNLGCDGTGVGLSSWSMERTKRESSMVIERRLNGFMGDYMTYERCWSLWAPPFP